MKEGVTGAEIQIVRTKKKANRGEDINKLELDLKSFSHWFVNNLIASLKGWASPA